MTPATYDRLKAHLAPGPTKETEKGPRTLWLFVPRELNDGKGQYDVDYLDTICFYTKGANPWNAAQKLASFLNLNNKHYTGVRAASPSNKKR